MAKALIYVIIASLSTCVLKAQSHSFKLNGKIPGIHLTLVQLSPNVGAAFKIDTTFVFEDSFVVIGSLKNPYIFALDIKSDSVSRFSTSFIVEPGEHEVKITFNDSVFAIDSITNSPLEDEYLNHFLPFFHQKKYQNLPTKEEIKSTKRVFESNILGMEMNFVSDYLQMHPRSFVGFLIFYRKVIFSRYDNNASNQKIFMSLDTSIRKTASGRELLKLLRNERSLLVGKTFPQFVLKGTNNKVAAVSYKGNSLTLVDYWATWCLPCIREIPTLRTVQDKYQRAKFNVISISVDATKDLPKLKKFVDSLQMHWVNYWDENGGITDKYKIFLFPTYFLLNEKGEIIARGNRLKPILDIIEKKLE
jgi:thiol-disulfide isomerase/thioredoxin